MFEVGDIVKHSNCSTQELLGVVVEVKENRPKPYHVKWYYVTAGIWEGELAYFRDSWWQQDLIEKV